MYKWLPQKHLIDFCAEQEQELWQTKPITIIVININIIECCEDEICGWSTGTGHLRTMELEKQDEHEAFV